MRPFAAYPAWAWDKLSPAAKAWLLKWETDEYAKNTPARRDARNDIWNRGVRVDSADVETSDLARAPVRKGRKRSDHEGR